MIGFITISWDINNKLYEETFDINHTNNIYNLIELLDLNIETHNNSIQINEKIQMGNLRYIEFLAKNSMYLSNMYNKIEESYINFINMNINNLNKFDIFCLCCNRNYNINLNKDILKMIYNYIIEKTNCHTSFYSFRKDNTDNIDILYLLVEDTKMINFACSVSY
jgi:hypothetical protein